MVKGCQLLPSSSRPIQKPPAAPAAGSMKATPRLAPCTLPRPCFLLAIHSGENWNWPNTTLEIGEDEKGRCQLHCGPFRFSHQPGCPVNQRSKGCVVGEAANVTRIFPANHVTATCKSIAQRVAILHAACPKGKPAWCRRERYFENHAHTSAASCIMETMVCGFLGISGHSTPRNTLSVAHWLGNLSPWKTEVPRIIPSENRGNLQERNQLMKIASPLDEVTTWVWVKIEPPGDSRF